jgi:hypothetical protein
MKLLVLLTTFIACFALPLSATEKEILITEGKELLTKAKASPRNFVDLQLFLLANRKEIKLKDLEEGLTLTALRQLAVKDSPLKVEDSLLNAEIGARQYPK